MTRYNVQVFRKGSLYPDRGISSISLGRILRRIDHLEMEGFEPVLTTIHKR
jgi:hypothetical protein